MMIYVALTDLCDGFGSFCATGARRWQFVGADSSFTLDFARRGGQVAVSSQRADLDVLPAREVALAIDAGVRAFLSDSANGLPPGDPAGSDLRAATAEFAQLLDELD